MYTLVIVFHIIVCLLLIMVILIQSGRGGGFLESFSGLDTIFGTKTNTFLVRSTTVLATIFLLTCLGLAFLSSQRSKSLIGKDSFSKETLPLDKTEQNIPLEDVKSLPSKETTSNVEKKTQENSTKEVSTGVQDSLKSEQNKKEASESEK